MNQKATFLGDIKMLFSPRINSCGFGVNLQV
jgi:hypothetical protein